MLAWKRLTSLSTFFFSECELDEICLYQLEMETSHKFCPLPHYIRDDGCIKRAFPEIFY